MAKAASLVFGPDAVLWGADAPKGPHGIWRWPRGGAPQRVQALDGPVLWSTRAAGAVAVATEVEGEGVDGVELWTSPDGLRWTRRLRAPAFHRGSERRWGTVSFPLGSPPPALFGTVERLGAIRRAAVRVDAAP